MGASVAAMPALAAAVARLGTLGCHPPSVLKLLASAGIFTEVAKPRAIDLGCGRGEMAVALAAAFGVEVLGIDLHPEFLAYARRLERSRVLAAPDATGRCRFRTGDAARPPHPSRSRRAARASGPETYHLAVMLNVLPFEQAAPLARRYVSAGGYYLIDDALAKPGSAKALQTGAPLLSQVRAFIRSQGDELVGTKSLARVAKAEMPERLAQLRSGITAAANHWPKCRLGLAAMLKSHEAAARLIGPLLHPTLLLVRRGSGK